MSNLVLNTKTYTGSGILNGIASWWDRSGGVAALFNRVTASIRINDKARVQWKIEQQFPQPEGAPVCCGPDEKRQADADIRIRLHPSLDATERTDFKARLVALVSTSDFSDSIVQLQVTG